LVYLIIKYASIKFKELGESKYSLWIMRVQIRQNAKTLPILE